MAELAAFICIVGVLAIGAADLLAHRARREQEAVDRAEQDARVRLARLHEGSL